MGEHFQAMETAASLRLMAVMALLSMVLCDLPVHCLHKDIKGEWLFQMSEANQDKNSIKCSTGNQNYQNYHTANTGPRDKTGTRAYVIKHSPAGTILSCWTLHSGAAGKARRPHQSRLSFTVSLLPHLCGHSQCWSFLRLWNISTPTLMRPGLPGTTKSMRSLPVQLSEIQSRTTSSSRSPRDSSRSR